MINWKVFGKVCGRGLLEVLSLHLSAWREEEKETSDKAIEIVADIRT
jgi:hypothetical protein